MGGHPVLLQYYRVRRYMKWLAQWPTFSTKAEAAALPHVIASHQTPLLRQLAAVDMWMQHNKIINLRLACGKLNGIVIEPGQRFSYWCLIANRLDEKAMSRAWGGYVRHNRLHRGLFFLDGEWLDDKFITENHAVMMYEPFLPAGAAGGEDMKKPACDTETSQQPVGSGGAVI